MDIKKNKFIISSTLFISALSLLNSQPVCAALALNLSHQSVAILQQFSPSLSASQQSDKKIIELKESSRDMDFNQTLHVRIQEKYNGYPVMGADAILHIPHAGSGKQALNELITSADRNSSINGVLYQNLDADLTDGIAKVISVEQQRKAVLKIWREWRAQKNNRGLFLDTDRKEIVIYVDKAQKAHWAYKISFILSSAYKPLGSKPVYIIDAMTLTNYAQWDSNRLVMKMNNVAEIRQPELAPDNIPSRQQFKDYPGLVEVKAGGFGGNEKTGKIIYDGFNYPPLSMLRDASSGTCYLSNASVIVMDDWRGELLNFPCQKTDIYHPNLYWNGNFNAENGGYSPTNDALYAGTIITQMFQKWYGIPPLTDSDGMPKKIEIYVHANISDGAWDGLSLRLGNGSGSFYPFTSLAVVADMFAFDFTAQHSKLEFGGDSEANAISYAFGSMTAQAVKYFVYHKTDWQVGEEVSRDGIALHYLDQPSRDCRGKNPGEWCHIDSANQYDDRLWSGYACGVYEHAFYLLATTPGCNIKKAYDVMLKANEHYWYSDINFTDGACGVIKAAKDYGYDTDSVSKAFNAVDIDTSEC